MNDKKRVLITGVAGFVGSNLAKKCLELGYDVTGIDNFSAGDGTALYKSLTKSLTFRDFSKNDFLGNYSNASSQYIRDLKEGCFDVVFHLAASARVSMSVEDPIGTNENNVTKTLALLEMVREGSEKRDKPTRFVFSSSSAVYGDTIWTEGSCGSNVKTTLPRPTSPYAIQKLTAETYVTQYSKLYKFDGVSLRYFNIYGEQQYANSAYTTAVAAWMHAAKHGKTARYDGDGGQQRDLVHVSDVVNANIIASNAKLTDLRVFNVGTGEVVSNEFLLSLIKETTGKSIQIQRAPARLGDVRVTRADPFDAEVTLGFRTKVRLLEGLKMTWDWCKKEESF